MIETKKISNTRLLSCKDTEVVRFCIGIVVLYYIKNKQIE